MTAGESPPSTADPLLGKVISERYKVIRKLGEGGMGAVYQAEHVFIEKKVALKLLAPELARRTDLVARFLQEARSASRIGHENVIDISDFGETADGFVFIAMEYLDGVDLGETVRKVGPMPWPRARPIVLQICRALRAAHAQGIVHRDMKPENIFLIQREGRPDFVKLLDFGIAKVMGIDNAPRLTRTGMIFGTPEYMSPEQAEGKDSDHRVDIYALGCVIYHVLTGEAPFQSDSFMGMLTKHLLEDPVPPSVRRPDLVIPAALDALVGKALEKDRDQRWQSMQELLDAIDASTADGPAGGRGASTRELGSVVGPRAVETRTRMRTRTAPVSAQPTPSRRLLLVATGAGLGVAAALWWALSRPASPPPALPVTQPAPAPSPPPAAAAPGAASPPVEERPTPEVDPPHKRPVRVRKEHPGAKRGTTETPATPGPTKKALPTPPELKPFPQ